MSNWRGNINNTVLYTWEHLLCATQTDLEVFMGPKCWTHLWWTYMNTVCLILIFYFFFLWRESRYERGPERSQIWPEDYWTRSKMWSSWTDHNRETAPTLAAAINQQAATGEISNNIGTIKSLQLIPKIICWDALSNEFLEKNWKSCFHFLQQ